jgi:hypothetical protein
LYCGAAWFSYAVADLRRLVAQANGTATYHAQKFGRQLDHSLLNYFFFGFDNYFHGYLRAKVLGPELDQKPALFGSKQGQSDV